jgi:hypothetical protein
MDFRRPASRVSWTVRTIVNMFKYQLNTEQISRVVLMEEFANGATQVSVRLRDGRIFPRVLISSSKWIVAVRGFDRLPFNLSEIDEIFQTKDDKDPAKRDGWIYWDDWK